jgi:hypothetical protein
MYKKDDSTMFRILVGNRTHLNDVLKDYKFVKNIFDYINADSLFFPKKDDAYFLYTKEMNLSTKELKEFDRLADNLSYNVICVVETQLDKKSAFYKHYKNKLEYVDEFVDKSVRAKAKMFLKTKDIDILKQLDKNEYVSFLYAIYYGVYGNNKYKWNSGFVISQILEGQLRVEDSIKMFVYLTK